MRIIAPFLACIIEPNDTTVDNVTPLERAIAEGYSEIYIPSSTGFFKYHVLRPGKGGKRRYVCLPAKDAPELTLPSVKSVVEFLPDGKIPMTLLKDIMSFFSQVITKKGKALEAMIWILWNEAQGYHLHVPNQRVSAASASYDWASLPVDSSIIVDIHSHGSMSAFFSSTDDNDDNNSIRFSGVIGFNDRPDRVMKFRFNYLGQHFDVKTEDLFTESNSEIPEDWFDKVNTNQYVPGAGQIFHQGTYLRNYRPGASMAGPVHGIGYTPKPKEENPAPNYAANIDDLIINTNMGTATVVHTGQGGAGLSKKQKRLLRRQEQQMGATEKAKEPPVLLTQGPQGSSKDIDTKEIRIYTPSELKNIPNTTLSNTALGNNNFWPYVEGTDDELPIGSTSSDEMDTGKFDTLAINHGIELATLVTLLDDSIPILVRCQDQLREYTIKLFEGIEPSDKLKVFRALYELLPATATSDLAMNGL